MFNKIDFLLLELSSLMIASWSICFVKPVDLNYDGTALQGQHRKFHGGIVRFIRSIHKSSR